MVGIVEEVGSSISRLHPGDRVAVNVETFCGDCFFCRHGYVNNCTDPNGGWALGRRIDGGQAEYVRVPYADQGLTKIPDGGIGSAGPFAGGLVGHRFLGHQDLPHYARGHGSPSRCRAHRVVYPPVYLVKTAQRASLSVKSPPNAGILFDSTTRRLWSLPRRKCFPLPYPIRSTGALMWS